MEITVTLEQVSLRDAVATLYHDLDEEVEETTLGEVIAGKIVAALIADADRWRPMVERMSQSVNAWLREQAAGRVEEMIAAEIDRQLTDDRAGAVTRGQPSTKLAAYVSTEVTAQLRARCAVVVEAAMADLRAELGRVTSEVVAGFRDGLRKP